MCTLKSQISGIMLLACTALIIILTGCTRAASRSPVDPTSVGQRVQIDQVRVTQGTGIYVTGQGLLPQGACIQTALYENGSAASWWPTDVCIQPDTGRWEILVPLGSKGAPDQLAEEAQYEVRAWWPEKPEEIAARFPFDLSGPKPPGEASPNADP